MIFAEANALKNLHHKNIVKMLNCFIFQDMRAVFIMEYLKGGDLSEYLSKEPN
jgi:serine/threonine protein kinase